MSDSKLLLEWFGSRRESKVMGQLTAHSLKIIDTVTELDRSVHWMSLGEQKAANEAIERLMISEREADNFEEMVNEELSKGGIGAGERGDLLRLVRMMDNIADHTKEAGMNIRLFMDLDLEVPPCIWETIKGMTSLLIMSCRHMRRALEKLGVSPEGALSSRMMVEQCERDLDELFYNTKRILMGQDISFREVFIVREVLHAIENASDYAKDTTDMLHIIVTAEIHQAR